MNKIIKNCFQFIVITIFNQQMLFDFWVYINTRAMSIYGVVYYIYFDVDVVFVYSRARTSLSMYICVTNR